jgi:DNA repair protein RadC
MAARMQQDERLLADLLGASHARRLLRRFTSLPALRRASDAELDLPPTIRSRLHAALGIADRLLCDGESPAVIASPRDAHSVLAPELLGAETEELWGLYLDARHRPIASMALTRGTRTQTIVDPAAIFRKALQVDAHAVIVAHNHPSGDPTPSLEDFQTTTRLVEVGRLLGIAVLDHLVIAGARFTSLRTQGGVASYGAFE